MEYFFPQYLSKRKYTYDTPMMMIFSKIQMVEEYCQINCHIISRPVINILNL